MQQRRRSLISAFYILFLDNFGFAVIFPIFPTLFLDTSLGILPAVTTEAGRNIALGLLLAAFPFAQFFGAPFFGNIADRFGRKKALAWTITGTIVGYALTAIGITTKLYSLLIVSRVLTGFFAGNLAICMAIIVDLNTGKKERGKSLSLVAAFLGLSWIGAIVVGSIFTNPLRLQLLNPSFPFWIVAALSLTSLLILWKLYRETFVPEKKQIRLNILKGIYDILHVLENKQLRVLYLTLFFWFFGFFISLQWAAPISIEKFKATETQIMWFFVVMGILWTLASGLLNPWLIEHSSLWKITLWSLFLVSLFFFFSGVADFYFYFTASYVISGIFAAIAWGNAMSLISLASPAENQGKSLGVGQSMLSLGQFLGPLFGGFIAGFSIEPIFYVCAFLVFVSFLLLLVYVIRRKGRLLSNY